MSQDFKIDSTKHLTYFGSLKNRADKNIAAIEVLQLVESENRPANTNEQEILIQYSGWGSIPQVFKYRYSWDKKAGSEWHEKIQDKLRELLTDVEFSSAQDSINNSHFTSTEVIGSMWKALQNSGCLNAQTNHFKILEPSAGIGHFIGLSPISNSALVAVEKDNISARIIQLLYPSIKTYNSPFESTKFIPGFFDLVIGNVPFGDFGVTDPSLKRKDQFLTRCIHDYFITRSIDLVAPGGIVALITSRYTMDKIDSVVRKWIAERATLLGMVRLPNGTFEKNAGTKVVTDVIFFQKNYTNSPLNINNNNWIDLKEIVFPGDNIVDINQYFVENPSHVLGETEFVHGMYREDYVVSGQFDEERFGQIVTKFLSQNKLVVGSSATTIEVVTPITPATATKKDVRVLAMESLLETLRTLFQAEIVAESPTKIELLREKLNIKYNLFQRQYGFISDTKNKKVWNGAPDYFLLKSLETPDRKKSDIFKNSTFGATSKLQKEIGKYEADEALLISLNEFGGINWERIIELTGQDIEVLQPNLIGKVFLNPLGDIWETADQYLSGNVRKKLEEARLAANISSAYESNVNALEVVQPKDLEPGEIEPRLGAPWLPVLIIERFATTLLSCPYNNVTIGHSAEIASWCVVCESYYTKNGVQNKNVWGTSRITFLELLDDILNSRMSTIWDIISDGEGDDIRVVNKDETIAAREMADKIKERFGVWIFENEDQAKLVAQIYNETFNCIRLREYNGSHLTFPGMSKKHLRINDLDTHQKNAVWRILQNRSTLLGHCVGAGKTAVMSAAAMEMKRIGLANKSMFVVPNHLVEQWAAEFLKLYPIARLCVIGKDDFKKGNREIAISRIATGNFDAVIIAHRSFEFIPVSDEKFKEYVEKEINNLTECIENCNTNNTTRIVKRLESAKKRLSVKLHNKINKEAKDKGITFEELGIDQLFVDESDVYKNLGFSTKMNRIAGVPNTESQRAFDMYMKIQYILASNKSAQTTRGVVFATGTPISNTIAEMFTLMRYLGKDELTRLSIQQFDGWAATFGESVTGLELAPDGSGYRVHTRFARFVNVPELITIFRIFADIQTAESIKLPIPELESGKPYIISVPASLQQKDFIMTLVDRAETLRTSRVDPREDNMLMITTDGRKAALDIRLVDSCAFPDPNTKVDALVKNVYKIWLETTPKRLTQMIFLDISTPSIDNKSFNVYDLIRSKLINLGVTASDIEYIHNAESDNDKVVLFSKMNEGTIRILLGSTEKMGAGTNAQRLLYAVHHCDAPWRPRDIEQRDGRIRRPGNLNPTILNYRYVTEKTFDSYMWQTMETKARFIAQVITGDSTVRKVEDIETCALTYAEVKAIASGNPLIIQKVRVDSEVRKMQALNAAHKNSVWKVKRELLAIPDSLKRWEDTISSLQKDIQIRTENSLPDNIFSIKLGSNVITDKNEAGDALIAILKSWEKSPYQEMRIGEINKFEIISHSQIAGNHRLRLKGHSYYDVKLNLLSGIGTITSILYVIKHLEDKLETSLAHLEQVNKFKISYSEIVAKRFEHEEKLKSLLVEQENLDRSLNLLDDDRQTVGLVDFNQALGSNNKQEESADI